MLHKLEETFAQWSSSILVTKCCFVLGAKLLSNVYGWVNQLACFCFQVEAGNEGKCDFHDFSVAKASDILGQGGER